jgi:hypothetical protein
MKHIVSVSGGLSSAITLDLVIEKYGIENTVAVFCDTKTEDIDLYRFNTDIQNKYKDLEWITLCDGRDIWQLFSEKNFHGNSKIAPCSNILKQDIFRKWLVSSYPNHEEVVIYLGIGLIGAKCLHNAELLPFIKLLLHVYDIEKYCSQQSVERVRYDY